MVVGMPYCFCPVAADVARTIVSIIKQHHIVNVWSNGVAQNNMRNAIDDYFFDVVRDKKGIDIPVERLDELELHAKQRHPRHVVRVFLDSAGMGEFLEKQVRFLWPSPTLDVKSIYETSAK
jgi:hypothetical protein